MTGRLLADQISIFDMDNLATRQASMCIEELRLKVSDVEFGYRVQGLAAHVLLRLDCEIEEVNRVGHPDIVAIRNGLEFRFEVEAEVVGTRSRQLTYADFASLVGLPGVVGYYALAISKPTPRWILVPAEHMVGRKPSPNVLLDALSDREFSNAWTYEYTNMLDVQCRRIARSSFAALRSRALKGRGL